MLSFLGGLLSGIFKAIFEWWAIYRSGEREQELKDEEGTLNVSKEEAEIASENAGLSDDELRRKLRDPSGYR